MVEEEMSEQPKDRVGVVAGFVTAGHAILFEDVESHRCDVCSTNIAEGRTLRDSTAEGADDASGDRGVRRDTDESGYDVSGRGLLVWSRGGERRYQEPPLCSGCAAAIGVSALQRWEIEEEEG